MRLDPPRFERASADSYHLDNLHTLPNLVTILFTGSHDYLPINARLSHPSRTTNCCETASRGLWDAGYPDSCLLHFSRLPWERLWLFFGASFLHYSVSTVVQYTLCPEFLAVRLKRNREGCKVWDELLMRISNLMAFIAVLAIAGWGLGRLHGSTLAGWLIVLGFGFLAFSTFVLNWAMVVNPHFEPTVRIQVDRGHTVVTAGPY